MAGGKVGTEVEVTGGARYKGLAAEQVLQALKVVKAGLVENFFGALVWRGGQDRTQQEQTGQGGSHHRSLVNVF